MNLIQLLFKSKDNTIYRNMENAPRLERNDWNIMKNALATWFSIIWLMLTCAFMANANDKSQNIDRLMASFTRCDPTFFSNIASYKNELSEYTQITDINNNEAYIAVENRTEDHKNYHQFVKPLKYNSLTVTGYYDSALNLGKYGDYYFWGFIVDNSLQEIQSEFHFLSWIEMEKNSLYTANAKIHYTGDSLDTWHENTNTVIGTKTVPLSGTAEKLLLLENSSDMTLLVCSIQGFFPPELLATIRPDLVNQPTNTADH